MRSLTLVTESGAVPDTWLAALESQGVVYQMADPHWIQELTTDLVAYLPDSSSLPMPRLPEWIADDGVVPWLPEIVPPLETARESAIAPLPWIASARLIQPLLPGLRTAGWGLLTLANLLESSPFRWHSGGFQISVNCTRNILALVPHYHCQPWLRRCLRSLVDQTYPLTGIVVIDDGSGDPPIDIVREFPQVTLLASAERVGPYRLIQQVIDQTDAWGYLFQDADDWSTCDRLEKLVYQAEQTGAELVGTQEIRVLEEQQELMTVSYPLDVNAALAHKPGHGLLHPTSLVRRSLVQRLGGFATGLRFGGDSEFLLRAVRVAKVVNLPDYCYFRRKRRHSLTTDPETGLDSPARQDLLRRLKQLALSDSPPLTPLVKAPPVQLSQMTSFPPNRYGV